ncbi:MAG: PaaI family thioesterase [Deltaproteobacteria bacterium]|nr:PaaI family thioesterase [Deltaproteobacteria bacterium]MDQ3298019.1 PaaI family thioesterase [Myxococcota bacterium]
MPRMTIADIEALMDRHFPDWRNFSTLEGLTDRELTLRMPFKTQLLRTGGTISGPAMMALADTAAYFMTLALAGPVPGAATANLDIHFLARPRPGDIIATARMLRLGRRLAVSTVELRSDGSEDVVAHATVTYALPSRDAAH